MTAAHGYDVSPAMMARANELGRTATWHTVPRTAGTDAGGRRLPAIVTVFRLLLNVPPDVRDRAVKFAAAALPDAPSGLLVVQNHGNRRSLRHLRSRRRADREWFQELSDGEVTRCWTARFPDSRSGIRDVPEGWYGPRWTRSLVRGRGRRALRHAALRPLRGGLLYVAVRDL